MSDVSGVSPIGTADVTPTPQSAAEAAREAQSVDYDTFLRLLVTQLENQDPLEPISETEFVAQLATFSNVEQNTRTNENLAALITQVGLAQAADLVGRTVTAGTGETGVVEDVRVTDAGVFATLSSGETVQVGSGTTVR